MYRATVPGTGRRRLTGAHALAHDRGGDVDGRHVQEVHRLPAALALNGGAGERGDGVEHAAAVGAVSGGDGEIGQREQTSGSRQEGSVPAMSAPRMSVGSTPG